MDFDEIYITRMYGFGLVQINYALIKLNPVQNHEKSRKISKISPKNPKNPENLTPSFVGEGGFANSFDERGYLSYAPSAIPGSEQKIFNLINSGFYHSKRSNIIGWTDMI